MFAAHVHAYTNTSAPITTLPSSAQNCFTSPWCQSGLARSLRCGRETKAQLNKLSEAMVCLIDLSRLCGNIVIIRIQSPNNNAKDYARGQASQISSTADSLAALSASHRHQIFPTATQALVGHTRTNKHNNKERWRHTNTRHHK